MNKPELKDKPLPRNAAYDVDVEAIVEAVLADPSCAEDAKALLTRKMKAPDVVRVVAPKAKSSSSSQYDEVDDLWDNVPV